MRVLWFLPAAGLVGLAAIVGTRMAQPVSETTIINRYAAIYLRTAPGGATATDCHGTPGIAPVRIVVTCVHPDGGVMTFNADQSGRPLPPTARTDPST